MNFLNGYQNLERKLDGRYYHKETGVSALVKKLPKGSAKVSIFDAENNLCDEFFTSSRGFRLIGSILGAIKSNHKGNIYNPDHVWRN